MNITIIRKGAALAIVVLLSAGQSAFAQDAAVAVDAPASAPVPAADMPTTPPAENAAPPSDPTAIADPVHPAADTATATTSAVQDTQGVQDGVAPSALEETTNPEAATSTDIQVIVVQPEIAPVSDPATTTTATTTEPAAVPPDSSASADASGIPLAPEPLDVVADITPAPPEQVPAQVAAEAPLTVADLKPAPEFAFALTGKRIPAEREVETPDGRVVRTETVTAAPSSSIDNAEGVMRVSGSCSDAYYVVLLFKHQNDYKDDPRSYVVNRAYPCVGGSFSYSIDELPAGLPDGLYYLLIGQQGETTGWTPITGLTEVAINNAQR